MALSGTIQGSVTYQPNTSNPFSFYFTWSAVQNIANNYSDVTVNTYWKTTTTSRTFDTVGDRNASITINGTTTSITKRFDCNPWPSGGIFLIQTATTRVPHNSDGSKSITISVRANGHASTYGTSSSTASSADCTASAAITLDTIPRASILNSVACSTQYFDGTMTYKYTPQSASFYNRLSISLMMDDTEIVIKTVDIGKKSASQQSATVAFTSQELTPIYNRLVFREKSSIRFTLRTYSDSGYTVQIGSADTKEISNLFIPVDIKPKTGSISVDPDNVNGHNTLLSNQNAVKIILSDWSGGTGTLIKSYTIEVLNGSEVVARTTVGGSINNSVETSIGPFASSGNLTFKVTATDLRDRSSSSQTSYMCYSYSAPYFSAFNAYRADANGNANANGTYLKCDYTPQYSATDSNTYSVVVTYNGTNSSSTLINLGNSSTTYQVYLTITDKYGKSNRSSTITVFGQSRILNIKKNGTGVALGKMAESDNLFECKWDAKFDGKCDVVGACNVAGALTANGAANIKGDLTLGTTTVIGSKDSALKYSQNNGTWQTILTDQNIGNYAASKSSLGNYLPLSGGTLTNSLELPSNLYYTSNSAYGLNCQNSDIINANALYFGDASDSAGEAINFYRSSDYWDTLYAVDGALKFHPNRSTSGGLGGYTICNTSNFRRGTCTLSSSGSGTTVTFSSALGGTPTVILTPLTSATGVIAGKVKSASSTGFTAIIGGSTVDSALFAYVAVYI